MVVWWNHAGVSYIQVNGLVGSPELEKDCELEAAAEIGACSHPHLQAPRELPESTRLADGLYEEEAYARGPQIVKRAE